MRLIRSTSALSVLPHGSRRVVTIGAFDGLHRGHHEILREARAIADARGEPLTVLSFEPTPAEFFASADPPARLTCFRERYELLENLGVDELFCPHFRQIKALDHRRFVDEILVGALGASEIVVGHDFRFGAGRAGTPDSLRDAGRSAGFGVRVVDAIYLDGERISSTRIRRALAEGDLDLAGRMLGRDYSMSGRVVHGLGLGRDLGFPTANVNLKRRRAPVDGIFAVEVGGVARRALEGVASVGSRPTVGGGKTLLEVYIFDFDGRIYGTYICVLFKARLRAEENFASIEALKVQMRADVVAAKAALARRIA
jgi:riboflavin kinase / FMN adenylyltransferase